MPKVTYVHPDGTTDVLDVPVSTSIMEAALEADLAGIVAECGGAAMCATCHVYVRSEHLGVAPEMQEDEDECSTRRRALARPTAGSAASWS